jgi:curved DNA-binding protein CbpA
MTNNLYEVLGVGRGYTLKEIKAAHRKLSKKYHPDTSEGSTRIAFELIQEAYEVLSDPERRARYDETGRRDPSPVTDAAVQRFIDNTLRLVVEAVTPDGQSDDVNHSNILQKILRSMLPPRQEIKRMIAEAERKVKRCDDLLKRFRIEKGPDLVKTSLIAERSRLTKELNDRQDALELSLKAEQVLSQYTYKVGSEEEGQFTPEPTLRLRGSLSSDPAVHRPRYF